MRKRSTSASRGFTLVELLVALFVMAVLALLSWRGLDGMVRAREITATHADEVLALEIGLQQWGADLDALATLPGMKSIDWNGRVMRMARRTRGAEGEGVMVVAWARRNVDGRGMWLRWQSPAASTRGDIEQAWARAGQWALNPGAEAIASEVRVVPLDDWQIFFFRENAWTNPQSSDVTSNSIVAATALPPSDTAGPARPVPQPQLLPDGVRLVLALPSGGAVSGSVTRDWVRPTLGGGRGP
jgi:general secretion pathway protein J